MVEVMFREFVEPLIFEFEDYTNSHTLEEFLTSSENLLFKFLYEFDVDEIATDDRNNRLVGISYELVDAYYGRCLYQPFVVIEMDKYRFKEWYIKQL